MARTQPKPKPLHLQGPKLLHNKLIPWKYYERSSRKGYINRNEFIGGVEYQFLSAGVESEGLRCYYMRKL